MKILHSDINLLVHFPKDKVTKDMRHDLAESFRNLLGVNAVMVCDMECEIYAFIEKSSQTDDARLGAFCPMCGRRLIQQKSEIEGS